ncbi:hypothetical protein WDL1P1_00711 (plasmid) [Variovorax sp. WDL1]|uniref:efflux RND transporter permease subunit n=1 Tax=Variovorax sp. WDL1 TaxID=207745 RepID=UPI001316AA15|nr:hypothetical protein WDL1P1_00711 [Variovorax sp. WDL1]
MLNAIVDRVAALQGLGLVFFAVVIGVGVQAFRNVPVDAFPDVTPIQVNIYTESPGLAAEDVEKPANDADRRCDGGACPASRRFVPYPSSACRTSALLQGRR